MHSSLVVPAFVWIEYLLLLLILVLSLLAFTVSVALEGVSDENEDDALKGEALDSNERLVVAATVADFVDVLLLLLLLS
jgi:hypothetical protein